MIGLIRLIGPIELTGDAKEGRAPE